MSWKFKVVCGPFSAEKNMTCRLPLQKIKNSLKNKRRKKYLVFLIDDRYYTHGYVKEYGVVSASPSVIKAATTKAKTRAVNFLSDLFTSKQLLSASGELSGYEDLPENPDFKIKID